MSILRTLTNVFRNNAKLPESGRAETFMTAHKSKAQDVAAMETYTHNNIVNAIVSRLANDTSAVEWKLYRKQDNNRKRYAYDGMDDRVEVHVHPALTIFNRPNPYMTRQEMIEMLQQWIDLTGEGWLNVEYGRSNIPLNLWPKRPDKMIVVPSQDKFIAGYIYVTPDGERIPLERNEMIQLRMPNPLDMFRGIGPVQSLAIDLDASLYASLYNRNFFLNDASPGGYVEMPDDIDEAAFNDFLLRWREDHQGVSKAHRPAMLGRGMKWIDAKVTMKDMQFAELRGISDDAIMRAFGFPKFKLGIVDDVNRATADASELFYIRSLLKPRLERIKQALNNDFLPLFGVSGEGVEFDYICDEPEDEQTEAQVRYTNAQTAKMLVDAGYDPSMALEVAGLPPMMHTVMQNKETSANMNSNESAGGEPNEVVRSNNQE
jgi:HK97 family phage portal protein